MSTLECKYPSAYVEGRKHKNEVSWIEALQEQRTPRTSDWTGFDHHLAQTDMKPLFFRVNPENNDSGIGKIRPIPMIQNMIKTIIANSPFCLWLGYPSIQIPQVSCGFQWPPFVFCNKTSRTPRPNDSFVLTRIFMSC